MEPVTLLVLVLAIAASLVYAYVGRLLLRRRLEGDAALASRLFGVWWIGLALLSLQTLLPIAGGILSIDDMALYIANGYVAVLIISITFWALVYYFAFLLTGKRSWFLPITLFYGAMYVYWTYVAALIHYDRVIFTPQGAQLDPMPMLPAVLTLPLVIAIIAPPLIAAVGYFRLFFRVEGATQRYRIGLISATFVLWFLSSVVGQVLGPTITRSIAWRTFTSLLGLAAALVVLAAYRPPRWARERWGVESVDATDPPV